MLPEQPSSPLNARLSPVSIARLGSAVFENTREAILITDPAGQILAVNPAFVEITGYSAAESVGQNASLLRPGMHDPAFYEQVRESLTIIGQWHGEVLNRRKDGSLFPADVQILTVKGDDGSIENYIGLMSDLTTRNDTEAFFKHIATHDPLTNLPNRACFYDHLNRAIYDTNVSKRSLAVLFVDLDGFKQINDQYGHELGDQLLQAVADRLVQTVRSQDVVARMGGDEFTLILTDLESSTEAGERSQVLLQALARPFILEQANAQITASIGVVLYPGDAENTEALIQAADETMYNAKLAGKNQVKIRPTKRAGSRGEQARS